MIKSKQDSIDAALHCRAEIGVNMIRIVICDDSLSFADSLRADIRKVLNKIGLDAVIYIYENMEVIPETLYSACDVFFLDIDFSGKQYTGIDIARKIRNVRQDSVLIFVTNYIEYAPEGYEVQAFRYLLKRDIHIKLEQCLLQTIKKLQKI